MISGGGAGRHQLLCVDDATDLHLCLDCLARKVVTHRIQLSWDNIHPKKEAMALKIAG